MNPVRLVDELVEFIKPQIEYFELESNVNGIWKPPQVISGYLKHKKRGQDSPDFPYVIVRYLDDEDANESNEAKIRIIAGTYSEDEQNGWRDCLNVILRIKEALLKNRFFGGAFKVEKPIHTELPEEHPFPEWIAWMTIRVTLPQYQQEGVLMDGEF